MSLGNLLFRSQVLHRPYGEEEAQAMDLLMGLVSRLTEDFARGGSASRIIIVALQTEMDAFTASLPSRINLTHAKIMEWLSPYMASIEELKSANIGDASDIFPVLEKIMEMSGLILDDLHSDQIANRLNALADIVENDLGISYGSFESIYKAIFERITEALSRDFLQGIQTEEAVLNFSLSRQMLSLRRILRKMVALAPLPVFNRRSLVRDLQLHLEASGWNGRLTEMKRQIEDARTKLFDLQPLLQLSFNISVGRSVGAEGQLSWYASWFNGEPVAVPNRFSLAAESFAPDMGLSSGSLPIGTGFLEHWAHWTYALSEAVKALLYGLQMENGNRISPALNMGWQITMSITSLFAPLAKGDTWADFYKVKNNSIFQTTISQLLTFGGSFEQFPGFRSWLWATWPHDRDNLSSAEKWPDLIYNFFLSLFTLVNSDGKNHEKITGFTALGRLGGTQLAALLIGRKEWYYKVGSGNFGISVVSILLGGAVTFAGEIIAWLLAAAVARKISDRYWKFESKNFIDGVKEFFGDQNAYGAFMFKSYLEFYSSWGSFWEGDTSDGTFGVKFIHQPDGSIQRQEIKYAGYSNKNNSPYRLPFPSGQTVFCPQGHQGFSSHHFRNGLIYAVDFLLAESQLILAMRGGTVAGYQDHHEQGLEEEKNYIVIRHDSRDPEHDKAENGQVLTTFARYELAQPFGVRRAFAAMGIPQDRILGSLVDQGDPIMLLSHRPGFFDTDYLQVQISTSDVTGTFPSIPFVFREISDKGIPERGKYYGSSNRLKIQPGYSRLHPPRILGWLVDRGSDYVILQKSAPDKDGSLKDSHILLQYELPGMMAITEYLKISDYSGKERKATLEGFWSAGFPPPPGAHYQVGIRPLQQSASFDKGFSYLAGRDEADIPVDFPEGRPMDRLLNTGLAHTPLAKGHITGAGTFGSSEVHLEGELSETNHIYNLHHLAILREGKIIQYRVIRDYMVEGGVKKIFINGLWDLHLRTADPWDTYEIGASSRFHPDAGFNKVSWVPDRDPERYTPGRFNDGKAPFVYHPFPLEGISD